MLTFNFYKIASKWYMDDPAYLESGGDPSYLDVVGGMNDLLDYVAQQNSAVQLIADTQPFTGADEMVLVKSSGNHSGGYYRLHRLMGQVIDQEVWLNTLLYLYFKELAPKIYIKFI